MEWKYKEDLITCRFYLGHKENWRKDINVLMEELKKEGFERDKGSVLMRIGNYKSIDDGSGLGHVTKQEKNIYNLLTNEKERIDEEEFNEFVNKITHQEFNSGNRFIGFTAYSDCLDTLNREFKEKQSSNAKNESISEVISELMKPDRIKRVFNSRDDDNKLREKGKLSIDKLCKISNIARSNFYDIYSDKYKPEPVTLWRLFIGLRCSMEEAGRLADTVDYQFKEEKIDQIIMFCIEKEIYNTSAIDLFLEEKTGETIFS